MKRTFICFLALTFALSGCGSVQPESTAEQSTESTDEVDTSNTYDETDNSWVPKGFEVLSSYPNVAVRFPGQSCDDYNCVDIQFVTLTGCSYFYAAANALTEENGTVIGYDNASLPSLQPLQVAKFRFEDTSNSAWWWEISEVVCN